MSKPKASNGRVVKLTVIDHRQPVFSPEVHGKTWKRSECPTQRPCPRVLCDAHLYRVDAQERAGRKSLRTVTRDAKGHTISEPGLLEDDRVGTLEPAWLAEGPRPSCAWDVIEAARGNPLSNTEVGAATGRHRTLVARTAQKALLKLKAKGITAADLERLIDPEAANAREHESAPSKTAKRRA